MEEDRHIWLAWANFLHRWGLQEWMASLLEAAGPLSLLGAQGVYIAQPFLKSTHMNDHLAALSRMLESKDETQAFVEYLREANIS
jgi:hypothetical protein